MKKGILAVVIAILFLFISGGNSWAFCDPDLKLPENPIQAQHQIPGTVMLQTELEFSSVCVNY